ncbi:hypothetical protein yc1106_00212 [Curvularia clavata]|uniref:tRNA-splicing endonuclease subunit Sen2 n=1 Tax=Curvularia clavata TaxID=95742 RepID=A0A9Q9DMX9_CURCL|nr:hypothetical protein yc1106_00212 [Curvularia clavata]
MAEPAPQVHPVGVLEQNQETPENGAPRKPRPRRPNYNEIHAKPLPIDVYALPAFVPHNPISIVRLATSLILQFFWPPKSHKTIHKAYYSLETESIHVTDPVSIRALWEHGFWGKGSLSRSEPQWLVAEKSRRGAQALKTSTEVTQSRREERRQFKLERARAQREAIEQQLRKEGKLVPEASTDELVDGDANGATTSDDVKAPTIDQAANATPVEDEEEEEVVAKLEDIDIPDIEHLQLTPEEAFFLSYVLGALDVVDIGTSESERQLKPYPAWYMFRLYCAHASTSSNIIDSEKTMTHLRTAYSMSKAATQVHPALSCVPSIAPDNPFVLRYVVYHHFRSLGWVVRPGIKFAVDYTLYLRGPAFTHSEFTIMIIPSYSSPYWNEQQDAESMDKQRKDWWWFHRVNRVQSQVQKTLMLVYVEVPEPWDTNSTEMSGFMVNIGDVLKKYKVREFVFRRWSPSRNRD